MKFLKPVGFYTFSFFLGIFYSPTVLASAPLVEISHLVIKSSEDTLQVDLKIDSAFTPEMKADVLIGVPVRFAFSISLYVVNDFWFDRKAVGITVVHELRYEAIKRVYKIIRSRGIMRPAYIEDFDTARRLISEINDLEVISLSHLKKGEHYQLMVGTGLSVRKYTFFNLFREVKNDHYTINFIY